MLIVLSVPYNASSSKLSLWALAMLCFDILLLLGTFSLLGSKCSWLGQIENLHTFPNP